MFFTGAWESLSRIKKIISELFESQKKINNFTQYNNDKESYIKNIYVFI